MENHKAIKKFIFYFVDCRHSFWETKPAYFPSQYQLKHQCYSKNPPNTDALVFLYEKLENLSPLVILLSFQNKQFVLISKLLSSNHKVMTSKIIPNFLDSGQIGVDNGERAFIRTACMTRDTLFKEKTRLIPRGVPGELNCSNHGTLIITVILAPLKLK